MISLQTFHVCNQEDAICNLSDNIWCICCDDHNAIRLLTMLAFTTHCKLLLTQSKRWISDSKLYGKIIYYLVSFWSWLLKLAFDFGHFLQENHGGNIVKPLTFLLCLFPGCLKSSSTSLEFFTTSPMKLITCWVPSTSFSTPSSLRPWLSIRSLALSTTIRSSLHAVATSEPPRPSSRIEARSRPIPLTSWDRPSSRVRTVCCMLSKHSIWELRESIRLSTLRRTASWGEEEEAWDLSDPLRESFLPPGFWPWRGLGS